MDAKTRMQYLHRNLNRGKPRQKQEAPARKKEETDAERTGAGKKDPGKDLP
jgi:hypothetical protein